MSAPMKTFDVVTRGADGKQTREKVMGTDEQSVSRQLRSRGQTASSVRETGKGVHREISIPGMGERVQLKDLTLMCRQLATMVGAGLPLLRTLAVLAEQTEKAPLRDALSEVSREIQGGASLSQSMALQPEIFPVLLVKLVQAGELGGFLDRSLVRVAATFETDLHLRRKLKSAMMYPVVVLCICFFAAVAMLIFIVPVFEKMYSDLGGQLPLPTRVLVAISHRMWWIGPLLAVVAAVGLTIWKRIKDRPDVRIRADGLKLRLPVFGQLSQKIAISRFARNLATMLGSGVPVLSALDVVSAAIGNAVLTRSVNDVSAGVRQGKSIADGLAAQEHFPGMVVNMIRVGEDTGQMEPMLDKVADFYDSEVAAMTEGLTAILEPLLIVLLATVVGTMIVALYLPMFNIFNEIG